MSKRSMLKWRMLVAICGSGRIPCTRSPGPRCTDPMYLVRRDNGPINPRWGAGTSKRWSNPVRLAQWCLSEPRGYQYAVSI